MRFDIIDKTIESNEYIDITVEEIADLVSDLVIQEDLLEFSYILNQVGGAVVNHSGYPITGNMASRLTSHGREFFKTVVDRIKEDEEEEEEEQEIFYKEGDIFNAKCSMDELGKYRLSLFGSNTMALVKVENVKNGYCFDFVDIGSVWRSYNQVVKDHWHVTQEEFARIADGHPGCFTLIKEEEEEEEEIFYKVGDRFSRFSINAEIGSISIYQLYCHWPLNNKVMLVKVEGVDSYPVGHYWTSEGHTVKDHRRITQEEFEWIANGLPDYFTLIKEDEEALYKIRDRLIADGIPQVSTLIKEEEEKEETFYKTGDRFKFIDGSCIYTLSRLSSAGAENKKAVLVKVESDSGWGVGYIWKAQDYSVKDYHHITQEEFERIASDHQCFFTLIK